MVRYCNLNQFPNVPIQSTMCNPCHTMYTRDNSSLLSLCTGVQCAVSDHAYALSTVNHALQSIQDKRLLIYEGQKQTGVPDSEN